MQTVKVGIREFRADLAEYIAADSPVAVTRHGQTVGYFIPVHGQAEAELLALQKVSESLDALLSAKAVDLEGVVDEFKKARKEDASSASVKAT